MTVVGLITLGAFAAIIGALVYGVATESGWPMIIAAILSLTLGTGVCITLINETNRANAIYNNGIHAEDGGHWQLQVTDGWQVYYKYYYKCDKCGKVLKALELVEEEDE